MTENPLKRGLDLEALRGLSCPLLGKLSHHVHAGLQVGAESTASTSTSTLPSHRGPSRTLTAKKAVKVANKGVQAGQCGLESRNEASCWGLLPSSLLIDRPFFPPVPQVSRSSSATGPVATPEMSEPRFLRLLNPDGSPPLHPV